MNEQNIALYEKHHLIANNYSPRTRTVYLKALEYFLAFKGPRPTNVALLRDYRDHISKLPLSIASKNLRVIPVRAFFSFLNQRGEGDQIEYRDVFATFKNRNGNEDHIDIPKPDVISNFLNTLNENDARAYIAARIILDTGLRLSELTGLNRGEVAHSFVIVGKGAKQRRILCHEDTVALVRTYETSLDGEKLFPISNRNLQRAFEKYSDGTISPHTLRHVFATRMLEAKMPIHVVQKLLGHTSITTTTRYLHLADDFLEQEYHNAHKQKS